MSMNLQITINTDRHGAKGADLPIETIRWDEHSRIDVEECGFDLSLFIPGMLPVHQVVQEDESAQVTSESGWVNV